MYQFLYKYIALFQTGNYGKRIVSRGHKGTKEDPIPIPYVKYEQCVLDFMQEVLDFPNTNEYFDDDEDEEEVQSNNKSANFEIFNQILSFVRMEKFRDGVVLEKLDDGTIVRLISTLKTRQEAVENAMEFLFEMPYGIQTSNYDCFLSGAGINLDTDVSEKEANILNDMFEDERRDSRIMIKVTSNDDDIEAPWLYKYYKS